MFANGKMMLAPMVRIGTLPSRLIALRYGADFVFTPEIIDKKLCLCTRSHDPVTGITDFTFRGELVLRLHCSERLFCILQLGSADPQTALSAALLLQNDVAGIDLNCGCPKRFSTHAGMGAALLKQPDMLCSILETLVKGQRLPVSCKIRLLAEAGDTLDLVRRIGATGIHALTVHCRTPAQRYETPANWEPMKDIRRALPKSVALVLNGDVTCRKDMMKAVELTGCDSVMVARAAQHNLSVFRREGPVELFSVYKEYLDVASKFGNSLQNCKYCIIQSLADCRRTEHVKSILRKVYIARSFKELYLALGLPVSELPDGSDDASYTHGEDVENGYTREQQQAKLHTEVNKLTTT